MFGLELRYLRRLTEGLVYLVALSVLCYNDNLGGCVTVIRAALNLELAAQHRTKPLVCLGVTLTLDALMAPRAGLTLLI